MKQRLYVAWTKVASAFSAEDLPVLLVFAGMGLVAGGASYLHPGAGYMALGLLFLLYVRPLIRWIR